MEHFRGQPVKIGKREATIMESLGSIVTSGPFLATWIVLAAVCVAFVIRDLRTKNPELGGFMKLVWILTTAYSGPLGLALYWYTGRKQIARDSAFRRGARSTAHCYSGCGIGEIIGIIITAGILGLSTWWVAGTTFILAYVFGYALTVGPLMQEGVGLGTALWDAAVSESASIAVMEIVAIGVDLWLAGDATIGEPLFWISLAVSLTCGLIAAYPVNLLLIYFGVKEGMGNPRDMAKQG